jgi:hypothetical protein
MAAPSIPARGLTEQHKAGAPFRERGPSAASVNYENCKSLRWRYLREAKLDARASLQIVVSSLE